MNKKQRIRLSEANVMGANNPINQNNPKTSSDIEGGKSFFKLAVQNWTNRAIDPDNPKTWPNDAQSVFQIAQKFQNYPTQGAGWAKNILQLTHNKELVNHFKSVINNYHAQNNVQKLTESQLRHIIKESVRRVLNENVGDVRVISHGEWSDPEVEFENEPLNEARLRRIVNNAIKSVANKKRKY